MVKNNNAKYSESDSLPECNGCAHDHFDFLVLDVTLEMNIENLFQLLFTNSKFYKRFVEIRQTYDVKYENWPSEFAEDGNKSRTLRYTLSINYSIGPKTTPSTETQIMYGESRPGSNYLIDANCQNHGIPYAEHFYTSIRYCIKSLGENRTRVFITGKIIYTKTPWPFIKSLIEKTVVTGCLTSFKVLSELLQAECDPKSPDLSPGFGHGVRQENSRKPVTPKRRTKKASRSPFTTGSNDSNHFCDIKDNLTADVVAKILLIVLIALAAINVYLYYQLTSLETTVQKMLLKSQHHIKF